MKTSFHPRWTSSGVCLCVYRILEIYIPIRQFFYNLIHPEYSAVTDVYVLMFLADTVDFIIIVFGFWAFGVRFALAKHQRDVRFEKAEKA